MSKKKTEQCYLCSEDIDKIARGMNKKLLGSNVSRLYCLSCLANYLDVATDDLLVKYEEFKTQGCTMFQ